MKDTALVTGASSGIGAELARLHATKGGDLVLVARSEAALAALKDELESKYGVTVMVIIEDLSVPGAAQRVFERTEKEGVEIDVLINNAGVGGHGKFHERDLAKHEAMIQLNVAALTSLTHLYLQGMVRRNRGKILNLGSTAGFMPGPLQAVYYATKAYVVSWSQAIAQELSDTNITVTVLCPGPVNTGFVANGDLEGVKLFEKSASPAAVAACGYEAMTKGALVTINDGSLRFLINWIMPWLPRKALLKASRQAMEKAA
jgi:short-subunit dehydrogenase